MTLSDAYALIGVSLDASLDEVWSAYKKKATQLQTDEGNDHSAQMQQLDEALEIVKKHIAFMYNFQSKLKTSEKHDGKSKVVQKLNLGVNRKPKPESKEPVSMPEDKFYAYEIILPADGIRIPRVCPVCMKPTDDVYNVRTKWNDYHYSGRYCRTTSYKAKFPFACCKEHRAQFSVEVRRYKYVYYFDFKDLNYARLFSAVNGDSEIFTVTENQHKKDLMQMDMRNLVRSPVVIGGATLILYLCIVGIIRLVALF